MDAERNHFPDRHDTVAEAQAIRPLENMMNSKSDPVDAILASYGLPGPWEPLPSTGVANRIYTTEDVVLRVATDHPEAVADARTESIAAPVVHAAGVLTPRLIAFDDSRTLVDLPFSLWERVHGETLGLIELGPNAFADTWREVGRQLSRLHRRVKVCPDPHGYLDQPGRELDLDSLLDQLVASGRVDVATAEDIAALIDELRPHVEVATNTCFVHNDLHDMNIMCTPAGSLLAILDWGDAGWGDPTDDFALIPLSAMPYAMEGYGSESWAVLGDFPEARFVWDKLHGAMEALRDNPAHPLPLDEFRSFLCSEGT